MRDGTTVLCIGGPADGRRVPYTQATMIWGEPRVSEFPTGLDWPRQGLEMTTLRAIYRHATLTMQRENGRVEAFDFYLIDGLQRDDVLYALTQGYRRTA